MTETLVPNFQRLFHAVIVGTESNLDLVMNLFEGPAPYLVVADVLLKISVLSLSKFTANFLSLYFSAPGMSASGTIC